MGATRRKAARFIRENSDREESEVREEEVEDERSEDCDEVDDAVRGRESMTSPGRVIGRSLTVVGAVVVRPGALPLVQ